MYCSMLKDTYWAEVNSITEKNQALTLAVIELHLPECCTAVNQSADQMLSIFFCFVIAVFGGALGQ